MRHDSAIPRAAAIAAVLCCAAVHAADPYIGYIYPSGIQAGTTNRVIVGGQFLRNAREAFAGSGVKVLDVEMVPGFPNPTGGQRRYLTKWLAGIAEGRREQPPLPVNDEHFSEWRSNRWWSVLGTLDAQKISIVERDLFVPRNALQMTPALSQRLLVTIAADRGAKPGVREFRVVGQNGASAPHPFLVTAFPHQEEPLYVAPARNTNAPPAVARIPCFIDGQIYPGSTDSWRLPGLKRGRVISFRAYGREFQPYIGDAVPGFFNPVLSVVDAKGHEVAFADDFYYHPDPVLVFKVPADGDYVLKVRDNLYRGRADFVYTVKVEDGVAWPMVAAVPLAPMPNVSVPEKAMVAAFKGVVAKPGAVNDHELELKEPGEYVFDLAARRTGSPLDAKVLVLDSAGGKVAEFCDVTNTVHAGSVIQAECDPVGAVKLKAGRYRLRVSDEAKKGGPAYRYVLRVHRPAPRFELWADRSGFALRRWWRAMMPIEVVRRDGFKGAIKLEDSDLFKFTPSLIPAESNKVVVSVLYKAERPETVTNVMIWASADIDGRKVRVPVNPANKYNQAFAWDHYLPARSFFLRGFRSPPPKVPPRKPAKIPPKKKKPVGPEPPSPPGKR